MDLSQEDFQDQLLIDEGLDRRFKVSEQKVKNYPYNCIGLIKFRTKNNRDIYATGFLISSNLVLTSAHSIFSKDHFAEPISFYCGQNGQLGRQVRISQYKIKEQFRQLKMNGHLQKFNSLSNQVRKRQEKQISIKYDYVLIKLKEHINIPNYIKLSYNDYSPKYKISIPGYPGQKKYKKDKNGNYYFHQYEEQNFPEILQGCLLLYKIDTSSGQSGSPILWQHNNYTYAIGLHKCGIKSRNLNAGLLFDSEIISQLKQWEEQLNCSIVAISHNEKLKISQSNQIIKSNLSSRKTILSQNSEHQHLKYRLQWDSNSLTLKNFKCTKRIKKIDNSNDQYQIYSQDPIPINLKLKLKIIKYGNMDSLISFGLITAKNKKLDYSCGNDSQSVGICTDNRYQQGWIITKQNRISHKKLFIKEGREMTIDINLAQWMISLAKDGNHSILTFLNESQKVRDISIPDYLKNKELFLYFTLKHDGDCIQITEL